MSSALRRSQFAKRCRPVCEGPVADGLHLRGSVGGTLCRGVTLLELLLAVSLLLLTMGALFGFYGVALRATSEASEYTMRSREARVILQQIARDIRQAAVSPSGGGAPLRGTMHSITIRTVSLPDPALMLEYGLDEEPPEPSADVRQIEYFLAVDEEETDEQGNPTVVGLVRREQKRLTQRVIGLDEQELTEQVRLVSPDVKYVRFRYFDGADWTDVWMGGPGNSLPQAVRIEIGFEPDPAMLAGEEDTLETDFDLLGTPSGQVEPQDRYSLVVRLPTADVLFGSRLVAARQELARESSVR